MAGRPILQFLSRFNTRVSWLCLLVFIFFVTTFSHLNFNQYTSTQFNAANIPYTHPGQPLPDDTQSSLTHSPSYTELAQAPLKVYVPPQPLSAPDPLVDIWATAYHKTQASQEEGPNDKEAYSKALNCPKCPDFKQMLANVAQESASSSKDKGKGLSEGNPIGKAHCPDFKEMFKNVKAQECEKCPFDVSRCPGGIHDTDPHHHTNVGQLMTPTPIANAPETTNSALPPKKTLISYIYNPSPSSFTNLQFFTTHALHSQADFVITLFEAANTTAPTIPAEILNLATQHPNIRILKKPSPDTRSSSSLYQNTTQATCPSHPLFPHFEILNGTYSMLKNNYSHFILLDSSARGPFLPRWSRECWSDAFLSLLVRNEKIKMVSTGLACLKGFRPYLQTQILGLNSQGLDALLEHVPKNGTFSVTAKDCEMKEMMAQKITQAIRNKGWDVVVLDTTVADVSSYRYAECVGNEERFTGGVEGGKRGEVDPWEVLFVDSSMAAMEGGRMELLSGRVKKGGYSSWDICGKS